MESVFGGRIGVEELIEDLPIRADGSMSGILVVVGERAVCSLRAGVW